MNRNGRRDGTIHKSFDGERLTKSFLKVSGLKEETAVSLKAFTGFTLPENRLKI
jgi:hypothetical protein